MPAYTSPPASTPNPATSRLTNPISVTIACDPMLCGMTADTAVMLVVKATAGADAPERCAQAFTVAASGVAAGAEVSLWLTGESAWFALPGRAETFALPHAPPLADLLAGVLAGGRVTLCSQCAARREITAADVLGGVRIAGAAAFVEEVLADRARALVY